MKRILATLISGFLIISLSACTHSSGNSGGQNPSTPDTSSKMNQSSQKKPGSSSSQNETPSNTDQTSKNSSKTNPSSSGSTQSSSSNKNSSQETFYGQWQIILSAASNPNGETYSNSDWNTLKGKTLTFSKDRATCFGDKIEEMTHTVSNPVYKKTVLSNKEFQADNKIPLNNLPGIQGNSITEVDVTGPTGVCSVFYTSKYNNMLLLYGGGEIFVLEPPNLSPSDVQAINKPSGAWVKTFEQNLFKGYHVIPSRYKSIGNGNWEVWVREVNSGQYGYVTVNQNTGNFHG